MNSAIPAPNTRGKIEGDFTVPSGETVINEPDDLKLSVRLGKLCYFDSFLGLIQLTYYRIFHSALPVVASGQVFEAELSLEVAAPVHWLEPVSGVIGGRGQ